MKIALYIEDGHEQIVLTPESATEKAILGKMHDGSRIVTIARGAFYGCRGGWTRWKQMVGGAPYYSDREEDESTMIVLRAPDVPKNAEGPEWSEGLLQG